jgi:ribosomal protein L37AE/L43A
MSAGSAKIRWSRRVDPQKIRRLYESDAQGMLDEDLLNDVGYGIYVCCRESVELGEAARGSVKCRNCGQTIVRRLVDGRFDDSEILKCRACGWEIWCGDYHKSLLRKAPSRPYEPMQVFESFVERWPLARSPREKLLLIDRLIHEWHIHYRAVGWPLGTTVVRATARQMVELLEGLAYGAGTTDGLDQTKKVWRGRLEAKRMKVDLEAAARDLGIKGFSRMRKRELIEAIERADPQFFAAWRDLVYGIQQSRADGPVEKE